MAMVPVQELGLEGAKTNGAQKRRAVKSCAQQILQLSFTIARLLHMWPAMS